MVHTAPGSLSGSGSTPLRILILEAQVPFIQGGAEILVRQLHKAVAARGSSIRIRWIAREASLANGRPDAANVQLTQVGQLVRNQSHGAPGNLLDLYANADIPETETFGSTPFPIPGLRRSDTIYIFGSGYSLNEITREQWGEIEKHDTMSLRKSGSR